MRRMVLMASVGILAAAGPALAGPSPVTALARGGFERNDGQLAPAVRFAAFGQGYRLFLTDDEAVFALGGDASVRMRLAGGLPARTQGRREQGRSSYLRGPRSAWRIGVPRFESVVTPQVYPGIDRVFHFDEARLEYDFVVAPGADPGRIALAFEGAAPRLTADGALALDTPVGTLLQHAPVAYQERGGRREPVAVAYRMDGGVVRLRAETYDRTRTLVIDPVFDYSTYLGGTGWDEGTAVALDAGRNAYVVGTTCSLDFPVRGPIPSTPSGCDGFVAKLDPRGRLLYSTYLGGRSYDEAIGVAVDRQGRAFVVGLTHSLDFPSVNPWQRAYGGKGDAFVAVLDPSGSSLAYASFLGGREIDAAWGIAVDANGRAHVAGLTESKDFPTVNAAQPLFAGKRDAFVAKLDIRGSRPDYATFLGGSGRDGGASVALDRNGGAWITGWTESPDFPTRNPFQAALAGGIDAYVTALDGAGRLVYSTYLGGSGNEAASAIALDKLRRPVVAGVTTSPDFPTSAPLQSGLLGPADAFVTRLEPGTGLDFSTYLGGTEYDNAYAVAVAPSGAIYVAGVTSSFDYPTLFASQAYAGNSDAFVTALDATGTSLTNSTFLGGSDFDLGRGLAVDGADNSYVVGSTLSSDFPTVQAFQPSLASPGLSDAFVARIHP